MLIMTMKTNCRAKRTKEHAEEVHEHDDDDRQVDVESDL